MILKPFKRIHIIVLDSLGVGATPDASSYGDIGSDTFGGILRHCPNISIPNLQKMGIGNIDPEKGFPLTDKPISYYGKAAESSVGKDTMTGHWEIMGVVTEKPFNVYPDGFPQELINMIEEHTGRKIIGNKVASGTEIIDELAEEQIATGALILYTSADSVLQIAAHEDVIPLSELYAICEYCRAITLEGPYKVGRVIARPYVGVKSKFKRTSNRHDYAVPPPYNTILDYLKNDGYSVISIGKIADIFDNKGITESIKTVSNDDGMNKLIGLLDRDFNGLSFLNLVDFDALYGHRRDPIGYGKALEEFDIKLSTVLEKLTMDDLLIITADHGTDPTYKGTDHTREYIPILAYSKRFNNVDSLGTRSSFADIGKTVADNFKIRDTGYGTSFLESLV